MTDKTLPTKIQVMGVGVTPFEGYEQATEAVNRRARHGEKTSIVAINPEKLYAANKDSELREILNRPEVGICDGIGAAIAVRWLYGREIPRVTGVALFFELIEMAARKGRRVFLLGGSAEVIEAAAKKLCCDHPDLVVAGRHHGYFEDSHEVVDLINAANADIVFVAMGSPKQELWISEHRDQISAPIFMGIGGTLDVVSGRVKWAPALFRKTGTEWLYRLISEPKRWRRQLVLPKFLLLLLKQKFRLANE
jgi:N-acetylglucosaminyldiphosphoundecaprenol N-acetyl-beta-D-mannosaminyltransferase